MSEKIIYYLDGLGGSSLDWLNKPKGPYRHVRVWVDAKELADDGIEALTLPNLTAVIDPQEATFPATAMKARLEEIAGLNDAAYTYWKWDWRRNIQVEAAMLADRIRGQEATFPEGVYIVAFSMGGLLARMTWKALGTDAERLVKRIITIGTPHRGSYAWPGIVALKDQEYIDKVNGILRLIAAGAGTLPILYYIAATQLKQFLTRWQAMVTSWPGPLFLFPTDTLMHDLGDSDGSILWEPSTWAPSPATFNAGVLAGIHASQNLLSDPSTLPPAHVMRCVAGSGINTFTGTIPATGKIDPDVARSIIGAERYWYQLRADLPSFKTGLEGDGRVPLKSALVPLYSESVFENTGHWGLLSHPHLLDHMRDWLFPVGDPESDPVDRIETVYWPPPPQLPLFVPIDTVPPTPTPPSPGDLKKKLPAPGC